MTTDTVERKLAAILAADVVGYSRLMGADEAGTHARLRALRKDFIEPIAEHRGRIVKLTGDGALAEFASVVDAVECAVAIQHGLAERSGDTPESQRIEFRSGINLGDVIFDEDDIYGDGVNVAARLEALAPAGGVCIADVVYQAVRGRLDVALEDLGEQRVKNIAQPLRTWQWRRDAHAAEPPLSGDPNVFQICTLREVGSEVERRQQIGRGLRLPVNQDGERVYDEHLNCLTVIASEGYEDFAAALQTEYERDFGSEVRVDGVAGLFEAATPLRGRRGDRGRFQRGYRACCRIA